MQHVGAGKVSRIVLVVYASGMWRLSLNPVLCNFYDPGSPPSAEVKEESYCCRCAGGSESYVVIQLCLGMYRCNKL